MSAYRRKYPEIQYRAATFSRLGGWQSEKPAEATMPAATATAVDYIPVVERFISYKEKQRETALRARECISCVERVTSLQSRKRTNADSVADSVLETLDNLGVVRTPGQKQFHRAFFNACLPHIYGSDVFEQDRERILHRYGFKEVRYEVLVVCPRRWGKTYGVSMFMAALLWCVPDMWISIFSTGQRASTSMLELIYKWIANLSDGNSRLLARNHEKLYIRGDSAADRRRCYSYPSSVQVRRPTSPAARACALAPARRRRSCTPREVRPEVRGHTQHDQPRCRSGEGEAGRRPFALEAVPACDRRAHWVGASAARGWGAARCWRAARASRAVHRSARSGGGAPVREGLATRDDTLHH